MFSFNASQSKSRRFAARAALAGLLCLASAFLFLACPMSAGNGSGGGVQGNLAGTWITDEGGPYETTVTITTTTAGYPGSWEGTIVNSPNFTATTGVLICQITKYADNFGDPLNPTHANVGKFCGMYWKDLSAGQVYLADAYGPAPTYTHIMFATQAEAVAAFTPVADKVGNYIDWSIVAPYTKK